MIPAWPDRMSGDEEFAYVRHKPEQTQLYQLIERPRDQPMDFVDERGLGKCWEPSFTARSVFTYSGMGSGICAYNAIP